MSRDSLGDGYEMPSEREGVTRAIGRIEGMLAGLVAGQGEIRLDLQSMAEVQEKATARTLALEMRVESLERWQMLHNQHCLEANTRSRDRNRLLGGIAALLLLPTINAIPVLWRTFEHVLSHVQHTPHGHDGP